MLEKKKYLVRFYDVDGTEKQLWEYAENAHKANYKAYRELKRDNFFEKKVTFNWFLTYCLIGVYVC